MLHNSRVRLTQDSHGSELLLRSAARLHEVTLRMSRNASVAVHTALSMMSLMSNSDIVKLTQNSSSNELLLQVTPLSQSFFLVSWLAEQPHEGSQQGP